MNNIKSFTITLIVAGIFMSQNTWASSSINPISSSIKNQIIEKNVWADGCPIPIERLRLLSFPFIDFDGHEQQGELLVLDAVAPHVLSIMENLYKMNFPMETVKRIETYNLTSENANSDGLPIEHNNSASFHCRPIKDTTLFSIHAYGLAIDINPKQNPYVIIQDPDSQIVKDRKPQESNIVLVQPVEGAYYLNRSNKRAGMITPDDEVVKLFYNNGFTIWGGNWNFPLDTMHFQATREMADLLALMASADAEYFFSVYVKSEVLKSDKDAKIIITKIADIYKSNPKKIIKYIKINEGEFINNPKDILNMYS